MTHPSLSTSTLLHRLREQVVGALCAAFLVYDVAATALGYPVGLLLPPLLRLVLAVLVLVLLRLGAFRFRWVGLVSAALLVVLCLLNNMQLLKNGLSPAESLSWDSLILMATYVLVGSTYGAVFSLLTLGGVGMLLLLYPPVSASWLSGTVVLASVVGITYLLMQFIESHINRHERASDELKAARLDALTGINGRATIEAELRRAIAHALKSGTPLSVVVTDIDHFKRVNDQFGHNVGDDVLRSFAKRLRRNVGSGGGIVGRWGGEEFLIILPAVSRPDAISLAERLRYEVSLSPIAGREITASFGVASFRGQGDDLEQLFGRADERLYDAKNAGRNAVRG